jgi:hypothetical protein
MVFWFNQVMRLVIVHLLTIEPDEEPVLTVFTTRVLIQSIHECMQMLDEDAPIEDRKEFATELANMYEFICKTVRGEARENFFEICKNMYEHAVQSFAESGATEERWFEVSLIVITFDHLGDLFKGTEFMMRLLPVLELCREIDSGEIQQAIAYHFGVMAKKYPSYLPPDDGAAFLQWLSSVLTPETRLASPALYDNALVSVGHILEYWHQKGNSIGPLLPQFIAKFPPTENGDKAEGVTCLEILGRLSTYSDLFKLSPNFVSDVTKICVEATKIPEFAEVANRIISTLPK